MTRVTSAVLAFFTAATILLLNFVPGFGTLPGDFVHQSEGVRVMLPFASGALVLLTVYGLLRLGSNRR